MATRSMNRTQRVIDEKFELLLLTAGPPFDRWMSKEVFFGDDSIEANYFREACDVVFGAGDIMVFGRSKIVSDYTKWFQERPVSRPHLRKAGLDTKFEALSLLFGPPDKRWNEQALHPWQFVGTNALADALRFKEAVRKCFSEGEIDRVRIHRIAHDYAEWYQLQEQSNEDADEARER